ncbi:MAG: nucleoside hydrolase [Simkaniaceae bacterium]|nr:nucleoside hydrolase [Candidatus Sacchlamyda saccharinae]
MAAIAKPPLVIFTDPGKDVDDTFALMLAAESDKYDLRAVISANEDAAGNVARYARMLLNAMGKEQIPVYQGEPGNRRPHLLCEVDDAIPKQNEGYLEAIQELSRTSEKVYVLGIAAMSGMAKLTEQTWFDPERFELYQMGGKIGNWEYNVGGDPKASQKVLDASKDMHFVTSNTTFQKPMQVGRDSQLHQYITRRAKEGNKAFGLLLDNWNAFVTYYDTRGFFPYLSDALAFSALEKDFVSFEKKKIKIEKSDGFIQLDEAGKEVLLSTETVDTAGFIDYLLKRLDKITSE